MIRVASARWGRKKEKPSQAEDNQTISSLQGGAPTENEIRSPSTTEWSRNPSQKTKKFKKTKSNNGTSRTQVDPDPVEAVEWSRNPRRSKTRKVKKKKSSDDKSIDSTSIKSESDRPRDARNKRKGKRNKRGKNANLVIDDSLPTRDFTFEWSRVSGASDPKHKTEKTSDYIDEDETSLKSSNSEYPKKTKSARSMDSGSSHSRDVSVKSSASRKPRRKKKSTKTDDVEDSGHSRSDVSLNSSSSPKKTKSSRHVIDDSNDRQKKLKRNKSTRSVDSASSRSVDRSTKSSNHRRKLPKKNKSTRSMDSTSSHRLNKSPKKKKSRRDKSIDSSPRTPDDAPKRRKKKKKHSDTSDSAQTRDFSFEWSRIPASNTMQHKEESESPSDHSEADEEASLCTSSSSHKPLERTEPRNPPGRTHSGHSVGSLMNRSSTELTRIQSKLEDIKSSRSVEKSSHGDKDAIQKEEEPHKPAGRTHCPKSVDALVNRSSTELTRIQSKLEKLKSSRNLDLSNRSAKEEESVDQVAMQHNKSPRAITANDKNDGRFAISHQLRKELEPEPNGEHKNLQRFFADLEKYETDLMDEQNVLDLEKQNLQSRVFEQVKRQEQLETTLHALQEKYQVLYLQLDDVDHPVDSIHTRREMLQTENEVLRLRIKRQEATLEKYQKSNLMKSRENFLMSEVLLASPAVSSLTQSAPQIRGELLELEAKLKERDKTLEEQALQRNEVKAEIGKVQHGITGGDEMHVLQTRIADLEKEKKDFMAEIARLHKEGSETQEQKEIPRFQRSLSHDEEEDKADVADMKSILEEGVKEDSTETTNEKTQDVGFVGWLFGVQS